MGAKSPGWKGGKWKAKAGYVYIYNPQHPRCSKNKYLAEHILVMEKRLGRFLFTDENVHHLNGVRDDNRIENLELWVKPQPTGIRATDALAWAKTIVDRYEILVEMAGVKPA